MKITNQQWIEIIKLISTFLIGIITVLAVQSCTMSLSVSKNNSNSTQKTEQTTTSSIDSTNININPKNYQNGKKRIQRTSFKSSRRSNQNRIQMGKCIQSASLERRKNRMGNHDWRQISKQIS